MFISFYVGSYSAFGQPLVSLTPSNSADAPVLDPQQQQQQQAHMRQLQLRQQHAQLQQQQLLANQQAFLLSLSSARQLYTPLTDAPPPTNAITAVNVAVDVFLDDFQQRQALRLLREMAVRKHQEID